MNMQVGIVIPFYKNYDTIKPLLLSIADQDYKDCQVVVVQDGKDKKAENAINGAIKEADIDVAYTILPENGGASKARNHGTNLLSMCDTYFFIDADCYLYPGMLRECVTQLDDNPDVSFVYGNYRFDNKTEFVSQGFDPYLLETMNYIPTMSPVRREAFEATEGFRDLEYFQDWDLFYRLAKAGYKGKYIKEFIFSTKDDGKGISSIKGSLDKKCASFRKDHEIKDKQLVVTTHSSPLQAIQRAKLLEADYVGPSKDSRRAVFPTNYGFDNWQATYFVGCFNHPLAALENHMKVEWKKPIYHFIGTDVFQIYSKQTRQNTEAINKALKESGAVLFANSPRLLDELTKCGIEGVKLLYTPIYNMSAYKPKKMPKKTTVGVYYSDDNPMHAMDGGNGHSNLPLILDIARSLPSIEFKFFGGVERSRADNIEFCGRIPEPDMPDFINSCSMHLRSTIHDGFPQLPIQFMLCGRPAIVSVPDKEFKYADKLSFEDVLHYEDAKSEIINKIYDNIGKKLDDKEVKEYYSELMSADKFKETIYGVIK